MTTSEMPFDPRPPRYASGDPMGGADRPSLPRPGGLIAVCVIAIVLGGLGLCGSLFGLVALVAQPSLQKAFTLPQQPGMPNRFAKTQNEMQEKIQAVAGRYRGVSLGVSLLKAVFSVSLLLGGIMAMKLNPKAGSFLVAVFAAVIVFEILAAVVTVVVQLDMAKVMSEMMPRMMAASAPGADRRRASAALRRRSQRSESSWEWPSH